MSDDPVISEAMEFAEKVFPQMKENRFFDDIANKAVEAIIETLAENSPAFADRARRSPDSINALISARLFDAFERRVSK